VQTTLATQAGGGAWTSGGFVKVDAALAPGQYDVDVPSAAFVTGVNGGKRLWVSPGIVDDDEEYELVPYDPTRIDKMASGSTRPYGRRSSATSSLASASKACSPSSFCVSPAPCALAMDSRSMQPPRA
jgi:hypothetical protein